MKGNAPYTQNGLHGYLVMSHYNHVVRQSVTRAVFALCFAVLSLQACSDLETEKMGHLERGKVHFEEARYEKARVEFKNVVQLAPEDAVGHFWLANAQERLGNWRNALLEFERTTKLDPNHVSAKAKLGSLYLADMRTDEALSLVEEAHKLEPDNLEATLLQARAHARLGNSQLALKYAEKAYRSDPQAVEKALLLATLYIHNRYHTKAKRIIKTVLAENPTDLRLLFRLASIHADLKENKEADLLLAKINQLSPSSFGERIALSRLLIKLGYTDRAEMELRALVAREQSDMAKLLLIGYLADQRGILAAEQGFKGYLKSTPNNLALRIGLADLYEQAADWEQAKRIYREIIAQDISGAATLAISRKLAALLLKERNIDEADEVIAKGLAQNATDGTLLRLRAQIHAFKGALNRAVYDVEKALHYEPNSLQLLRMLVRLYLNKNKPQLALQTWKVAVDNNPHNLGLRLKYAQLLASTGRSDEARSELHKILDMSPTRRDALATLITLELNQKRVHAAVEVADQIKASLPGAAFGYLQKGRVQLAQGKPDEAIKEFEKALQMAPNASEPLVSLVKTYVLQSKTKRAIKFLETHLEENPDSAFAHNLMGELFWRSKHYSKAEGAFQRAYELAPSWLTPYRNLGEMRLQQGQKGKAVEILKIAVKGNQGALPLQLRLAALYEELGEPDKAIEAYEVILRQSPDTDLAANNLAMLLVKHRTDQRALTRASELVNRFRWSNNPLYLDTLGWVQYKAGDHEEATYVLTKAIEKAPKMAELNYHLGLVLHRRGETRLASYHLKQALEQNANFDGAAAAKALLKKL